MNDLGVRVTWTRATHPDWMEPHIAAYVAMPGRSNEPRVAVLYVRLDDGTETVLHSVTSVEDLVERMGPLGDMIADGLVAEWIVSYQTVVSLSDAATSAVARLEAGDPDVHVATVHAGSQCADDVPWYAAAHAVNVGVWQVAATLWHPSVAVFHQRAQLIRFAAALDASYWIHHYNEET